VILSAGDDERQAARPWWFAPALAGVLFGALGGAVLNVGAPLPPCTPPQAEVELVVDRFLTRLGSSEHALRDCFTAGRPTDVEMESLIGANPPMTYRIERIAIGRDPVVDDVRFAAVLVSATWRAGPPILWAREESRWILLRRDEIAKRWTIEETQPPRRP
jgi:hypothetical protein